MRILLSKARSINEMVGILSKAKNKLGEEDEYLGKELGNIAQFLIDLDELVNFKEWEQEKKDGRD